MAREVAAVRRPLDRRCRLVCAGAGTYADERELVGRKWRLPGGILVRPQEKRQDVHLLLRGETLRCLRRHRLDAFVQFRERGAVPPLSEGEARERGGTFDASEILAVALRAGQSRRRPSRLTPPAMTGRHRSRLTSGSAWSRRRLPPPRVSRRGLATRERCVSPGLRPGRPSYGTFRETGSEK